MDKRVGIIERLQMALGGLPSKRLVPGLKERPLVGGVAPPRNQRRSGGGLSDRSHH